MDGAAAQEAKPNVTPLLPPKKFLPSRMNPAQGWTRSAADSASPSSRKRQARTLLTAEISRKEPLEAYPLDSMTMVGSLTREAGATRCCAWTTCCITTSRSGTTSARTSADHQDQRDRDHVARVVQDAAGEWIERTSTLQLQEKGR
jgi:type IV pilus assembly protein PilP